MHKDLIQPRWSQWKESCRLLRALEGDLWFLGKCELSVSFFPQLPLCKSRANLPWSGFTLIPKRNCDLVMLGQMASWWVFANTTNSTSLSFKMFSGNISFSFSFFFGKVEIKLEIWNICFLLLLKFMFWQFTFENYFQRQYFNQLLHLL